MSASDQADNDSERRYRDFGQSESGRALNDLRVRSARRWLALCRSCVTSFRLIDMSDCPCAEGFCLDKFESHGTF
jgi:hypothetical protein